MSTAMTRNCRRTTASKRSFERIWPFIDQHTITALRRLNFAAHSLHQLVGWIDLLGQMATKSAESILMAQFEVAFERVFLLAMADFIVRWVRIYSSRQRLNRLRATARYADTWPRIACSSRRTGHALDEEQFTQECKLLSIDAGGSSFDRASSWFTGPIG